MTSTTDRVRACRRRQRRGLEQFRVELDTRVVLDALISARLIDEPEGEWDKQRVERVLSVFTDRALREARKKKVERRFPH